MTEMVDATDFDIIAALRSNPRATNKHLAQLLNLAETTIAQRIKSMAERNVMRVLAQQHIFSDDFSSLHLLYINSTAATTVSNAVAGMEQIIGVSLSVGLPNIFAVMRARSLAEVHRLTDDLGAIDGVESIAVAACFQIHKYVSNMGELGAVNAPGLYDADTSDNAIMQLLHSDGRQSNREVGRQTGISEGAVRQRLKKLQQAGIMQFEVVCSTEALGLHSITIVRLAVASRRKREVLDNLVSLEAAEFVAETDGEFNITALLNTPDATSLSEHCNDQLLVGGEITNMQLVTLVTSVKHQYHLSYFDAVQVIPRRK